MAAVQQVREIVYVVDDDPGVRDSLAGLLESAGLEVLAFESADRYLELQRTDSAACLIVDLHLPGMSGLDLQDQLAGAQSLPIIFISGRGDIPSTVQAMKRGAVEFLTKPIDANTLITVVKQAFEQDRTARAQRAEMFELHRRLEQLTPREREVLPLVVAGLLNKQAAAKLGISEVTLQIHRSQIMHKMQAGSLAELVRLAAKLEIPSDP